MSYENVKLLLPCNGSGATFFDLSRHVHPVQTYVNATQNTDQPNKYATSFDHDGASGTHLEAAWNMHLSSGSTATAKGAVDCRVDFWLLPAASGTDLRPVQQGLPGSGSGALPQGFGIRRMTNNTARINFGNLNRDGAAGYYSHVTTETITAGAFVHCRLQINSNVPRFYIDGVAATLNNENGSWQTDLSNVSVYQTNNLNIGGANFQNGAAGNGGASVSNSAAFSMDDLQIEFGTFSTADFTPPAKLIVPVSGTVLDDAGAAAERRVWVIPRAPQSRVFDGTSNAGDGTYSIDAPNVECVRVVLDDDAGTQYNDLIDRVSVAG